MSGFVHLHAHSYYSFYDSTLSPEELVRFARAQAMPAIALTDTNSFTGIMEFRLLCQEAGLRAVLGAEVRQPLRAHRKMLVKRAWKYRSDEGEEQDDFGEARPADGVADDRGRLSSSPMHWHGDRKCRAVLLARSLAGYTAISHVLTRRHLEADFDLLKEVARLDDSVIMLSDCLAALETARGAGCEVYGELIASPRRRRQNRQIYDYCLAQGLPLVMTTDAKMAAPEEVRVHNLLRAMGTLSTIDNLADGEKIDAYQYLQSDADVRGFFMLDRDAGSDLQDYQRHLSEAYANTGRIARACQCDLPYRQWQFPELKLENQTPFHVLEEMTWKGITQRYGEHPTEQVKERTRKELEVINRLGFTEYFLLVQQIIEEAAQRDYFILGRGSAANSIVTYALGISNVCPVKYNLYFERFLNPDRTSPPDIDLDFSWRERDDMIDWCFEHFGRDNVALISTISTLKYRQAIREVAKAYGIAPTDIDGFNKLSETGHRVEKNGRVVDYTRQQPWATILQVADRIKGFPHHLSVHCGGVVIAPRPVVDLMPLTLSAKGYAITQMDMIGVEDLGLMKMDLLGNRSLGVLKDILRMAGENGSRDYTTIPEKPDVPAGQPGGRDEVFRREAVRIKMPGTRRGTSVALAGALHDLEGTQGDRAELYARPLRRRIRDFNHVTNDPWTRQVIDAGQTMGCFYIESPGMRALFERLRCQNYEEVVVASSIIRPGVASSGMMKTYIDRHQGERGLQQDLRSPITLMPAAKGSARMADGTLPINAHSKSKLARQYFPRGGDERPARISELMLELLPDTHGVMVYQEDVLQVAHEVAGMSYSEADILRRAISGKMRSADGMNRLRDLFLLGCQQHRGVPAEDALELWRQLASFAGYSFCKGHSAAFAVLSYQVAYLKAHHPAEFFAAVITNQGGFYGPGAYAEEARRWGIAILHPCVNESQVEYRGHTLCARPVAGPVPPGESRGQGWLRPGLRFIGGLTDKGMDLILQERDRGGRFVSFHNFLRRCPLYDDEIAALIRSGACDGFFTEAPPIARAQALLEASLFRDQAALQRDSLFEAASSPGQASLRVEPFTHYELSQMERDHLGFMISGHPLDFAEVPPGIVPACDIRKHARKTIRMIGWGIAAKVLSAKNSRKPMKMLTLEDRTGTYEATLFPRVYAKFAPRTLTKGPYLVSGEVDVTLGSPTLNVRQIELLCML